MALKIKHKETSFGVGDLITVIQNVSEGDKIRKQAFEGMVIGIKGRGDNKSFTVRRVASQKIGVERIFPINTPTIDSVKVIKKGTKGSRRAKLYYTRDKSKREIDRIYAKTTKREAAKKSTKKASKN